MKAHAVVSCSRGVALSAVLMGLLVSCEKNSVCISQSGDWTSCESKMDEPIGLEPAKVNPLPDMCMNMPTASLKGIVYSKYALDTITGDNASCLGHTDWCSAFGWFAPDMMEGGAEEGKFIVAKSKTPNKIDIEAQNKTTADLSSPTSTSIQFWIGLIDIYTAPTDNQYVVSICLDAAPCTTSPLIPSKSQLLKRGWGLYYDVKPVTGAKIPRKLYIHIETNMANVNFVIRHPEVSAEFM